MKRYKVVVNIRGTCEAEVDADSEEDAIAIVSEDMTIDDIDKWEPCGGEAEELEGYYGDAEVSNGL